MGSNTLTVSDRVCLLLPFPSHPCTALTRLEQLDSLRALVRLLGVLLVHVVVDLRLRREGLEAPQDPAHELGHVGRGGGPGAGQRHVHHEDVGQDTGDGESEGGWGERRRRKGREETKKEKR